MKKINVLKPKFRTEEILEGIRECLDKGWTGMGFKTTELEEAWKAYTNLPNAHFLSSNTVGLHLALNIFKKVDGWEDGDEVITTPLTFVSTNHAIKYERLTPVFADVDEYLCLDPKSVIDRITDKTRAVIFVGVGGNVGQLQSISELCKSKGIRLILDAAHMSGTYMSRIHFGVAQTIEHVGQLADVTVFSFQAVKNLATADSGMICFTDSELDSYARRLSWLGINKDTFSRSTKGSYKWRYDVDDVGFKYHGNSIMAAIGLVQLRYLEKDNEYRRTISGWYEKYLSDDIKVVPTSPSTIASSRHLFQIRVNNREELLDTFYSNEIYPGVHYIDNTQYAPYSYGYGTCPNAHQASEELLTLPIHMDITEEDVKRICEIVNSHG